jgi:hypothetical protein
VVDRVVDQVVGKAYHYSVKAIAKRATSTLIKRMLLFNVYKWLFIQSGFKVKWLLLLLVLL